MTDTEDCPEALVQQHSGVWSLETIKHALIDCPAVFGTKGRCSKIVQQVGIIS